MFQSSSGCGTLGLLNLLRDRLVGSLLRSLSYVLNLVRTQTTKSPEKIKNKETQIAQYVRKVDYGYIGYNIPIILLESIHCVRA